MVGSTHYIRIFGLWYYYIVAKLQNESIDFLEPGKGTLMFLYYPIGSSQKIRLDSTMGEFDSGIRYVISWIDGAYANINFVIKNDMFFSC